MQNSVFVAEIVMPILKFVWQDKGPRPSNTILKRNKVGGFMLPNVKTYFEATVINYRWFNTGIRIYIFINGMELWGQK